MKRLLTLLICTLLAGAVDAQNMSVKSFSKLESDMDARVESRTDQNGTKAALIKVETTEKGFAFDVGSMGVVDGVYKTAEVWVYVPRGIIAMTIQHPKLGTIRRYEFPISIESSTVYRMELSTAQIHSVVEEDVGGQYFILKTEPQEVTLYINNGSPMSIVGGVTNLFLDRGTHSYRIEAPLYKPSTGVVTIADARVDQSVKLAPNYGFLRVESTPKAEVDINGVKVGETPYESGKLELGDYNVRLTAPNCEVSQSNYTLSQAAKVSTLKVNLVSYLSTTTLKCADPEASILVNEQERGKGSWSGELMEGSYIVKCAKDGHRPTIKKITVVRNTPQSVTLESPTPMYGVLRVNSNIIDIDVEIGGVKLGRTPNVFKNILAGERVVTLSKEGYKAQQQVVKISEGQVAELTVSLEEKDPRDEGRTLIDYFPVYDITLGKTNILNLSGTDKLSVERYKQSSANLLLKGGLTFWDHNNDKVFEQIYVTYSDSLPELWSQRGFDWSLSYNDWSEFFRSRGYTIEVKNIPRSVPYEFRSRKRYTLSARIVATSADKTISFDLNFNYGNDNGEGSDVTSKNSLYGITVKAL